MLRHTFPFMRAKHCRQEMPLYEANGVSFLRWRAIASIPPATVMASPSMIAHTKMPLVFDGAVAPVSGAAGVGSGVGVGNGAGAPCLPTATDAGIWLMFPHTDVPELPKLTDDVSTVSEPSELLAKMARPLICSESSAGRGMHTFAGVFSR